MATSSHRHTKNDNKSSQHVDALTSSMSSLTIANTIGDITPLIIAIDRFCLENIHFESSAIARTINLEMAASTDINQAALIPLSHTLFDLDTALKWGFFLMNAVPRILMENNSVLRNSFDIIQYNTKLVTIYDLGVQAMVWDFCEEECEEECEDVDY